MIRLWVEAGRPGQLRARLTSSTDVLDGATTTVTATGADAIYARVRAWLEEMQEKVR